LRLTGGSIEQIYCSYIQQWREKDCDPVLIVEAFNISGVAATVEVM